MLALNTLSCFILSSTEITDVKEHIQLAVTTFGTLKGTFAFADSKPRDELLQSDRIQIVKLTELQSLGGRTRQFQVPNWGRWFRGQMRGPAHCQELRCRGGCFLTCSWTPSSPVWSQSGISGSVLAMEVDVHRPCSLHLPPGMNQLLPPSVGTTVSSSLAGLLNMHGLGCGCGSVRFWI